MLSGALTEWLPAFGVSWHVVHVPTKDPPTETPLENVVLFSPATPVIVIGRVSKISSPRAMARRASATISLSGPACAAHGSNIVNARGSNAAFVGFRPTG